MASNLKDFREKHMKMTQEEFANFIGERQDTISRWEQGDMDDIPTKKLKIIAEKTGQTLDELLDYEKPILKPLNVRDTWGKAEMIKRTFYDYLRVRRKDTWKFYDKTKNLLTEYDNILKTSIKKPRIAFMGMSDVGKSTMINGLIGAEKMPTSWAPTTSIIIYIKHIEDRPEYIKEEAWVFKSKNSEINFDIDILNIEEEAKKLCIAKGNIEVINQFGTRQGSMYSGNAVAAVVYIDSDILRNVDLIDLPGFGTGDREADDIATQSIGNITDAVVYLSRANGFLSSGAENTTLRYIIERLPHFERSDKNGIFPLGNLFIIASQAHTVDGGNPYSLKEILDKGCSRFEQILPKTVSEFFAERNMATGYSCEKFLRNRFFTYSTNTFELRRDFEKDLRDLIEKWPECIISSMKQTLKTYAETNNDIIDSDLEGYDRLINDKEFEESELKLILENEPTRCKYSEEKRNSIKKEIETYCEISVSDFKKEYSNIISVDEIVNSIKSRGFKKKKEDMEALSNHISAKLENALNETLNKYSNKLKISIDEYITDFENGFNIDGKLGIRAKIPFNAKRAFASSLAGAATFGGLALWASTLGNLGAYILVAKGVSLLSALGISIAGGTATATAAVAAIGGPVVLGIALAVLAAISAFAIFSGSWQKNVAKKLVETYKKENALDSYHEIITTFWKKDTINAFENATDGMEREWQNVIKEKKGLIDNFDIEDIERRVIICKELKSFFSDIPLQDDGFPTVE